MIRPAIRVVACIATLLTTGSSIDAHADYEQTLIDVITADGRPLRLVMRFTDGIIGSDPVKLILYNTRNSVMIAETDFYRDIRAGEGGVYYCYEATSFACERVVRLTPDGQWVDEPPGLHAAASVVAYFVGHWILHGVIVAWVVMYCATFLVEVYVRFRMKWLRDCLFICACLMVYMLAIGLQTTLLTAVFAAALGAGVAMVAAAVQKHIRTRSANASEP